MRMGNSTDLIWLVAVDKGIKEDANRFTTVNSDFSSFHRWFIGWLLRLSVTIIHEFLWITDLSLTNTGHDLTCYWICDCCLWIGYELVD